KNAFIAIRKKTASNSRPVIPRSPTGQWRVADYFEVGLDRRAFAGTRRTLATRSERHLRLGFGNFGTTRSPTWTGGVAPPLNPLGAAGRPSSCALRTRPSAARSETAEIDSDGLTPNEVGTADPSMQ